MDNIQTTAQENNKLNIVSMDILELSDYMAGLGEKAFRARQIYKWIHVKKAESFNEMSDISGKLKERLDRETFIDALRPVTVLKSKEDGTMKFLFSLKDGNIIESVLMRYHHGNSVCISTQAGCRMGCRFCASTLDGLARNLEVSELLGQIYAIERYTDEKVSNIVLMGSGEPMDNYDNVVKFLDMISNSNGLNISQRNITLSTCGLVPKIYELADRHLQITLAISLHATSDETRRELMPIANKYSIAEILKACHYYFDKTGRRISFEYSLVAGVNDSREEAIKLASLLHNLNCHVNLIPVNPIKERSYKQSGKDSISKFKNALEKNRINVTIRREMGRDIQGACGQLRKSYIDKDKTENFKEQKSLELTQNITIEGGGKS